MQFSSIVPLRLKNYRSHSAGFARLRFGNRQLAQIVSIAVVAVVLIPVAFIIYRAIGGRPRRNRLSAENAKLADRRQQHCADDCCNPVGLLHWRTFRLADKPLRPARTPNLAGAGIAGNGHPVVF